MKNTKPIVIFAASISLFVILLSISNIAQSLELKTMDLRFKLRGPFPTSDKIFIVAMGDESVSPQTLGRWPWRRAYIASFVNMLIPYSPSDIVFDILFPEPSDDFPGDDEMLRDQSAIISNVYFPFYCIPDTEKTAKRGYSDEIDEVNHKMLDKISIGRVSDYKQQSFIKVKYLVMPIPKFSSVAKGSGYVNASPDKDGVTRRVPLVMRYKDYVLPSIAFNAALKYMGAAKSDVKIIPGHYIKISAGDTVLKIPVDKKCRMLVNHPGDFSEENIPMGSFVGVIASHDAVLSGEKPIIDLPGLKDKIVFLGLTATGTSDLRPTPYTPLFPMVGFQATITSNIISNTFMRPVVPAVNYIIIIIAALAATLITMRFKALLAALLSIAFALVYFILAFYLFKSRIVVEVFYPFTAIALAYTSITLFKFTSEEKEKKQIKGTFQRYVSSQVVDVLLDDPSKIKLGGERKRLSVFFSDIRGFTTMSEQLSPEEVVNILNEYLTEMIDIIFKYNGTLDKFIGDAVMAVWGAPIEQENHAELAVRAAIEMREKVNELCEKWGAEGRRKIGVGMGINTGDVVIGNMGSDQYSDYTVIGDNVNLAARLEENAAAGVIMITEMTFEAVKDIINVEKLEPLSVKGKEKPVDVYKVIGLK